MKKIIFYVTFVMFLFAISCDNVSEVQNTKPKITSLTAVSDTLGFNEVTSIFCDAIDEEGDSLNYKWSASTGTIEGTGKIVKWNAPEKEGEYQITCEVMDAEFTVKLSVKLIVINKNTAPKILSVICLSDSILVNTTVSILCTAIDEDDKLVYEWNTTGGKISNVDSLAEWSTPDISGEYKVSCTVTDKYLLKTTREINFVVYEQNIIPQAISITADSDSILTDGQVNLYCKAVDNEQLTYDWEINGISFSEKDSVLVWNTPSEAGNFPVTCVVTDQHNQTSAVSASFIVHKRNKLPVITKLTSNIDSILTNQKVTFECFASDPDGDNLTFSWSVNGESLAEFGNIINWDSPIEPGEYEISCNVTDIYNEGSNISKKIIVHKRNIIPVISELKISIKEIYVNDVVEIICVASDADNDKLTFSWNTNGGSISYEDSIATWSVPGIKGEYTIKCLVTDSKGSSTTYEKNYYVNKINQKPKIVSITSSELPIYINKEVKITCNIEDDDPQLVSYDWTLGAGKIIQKSENYIIWKAPSVGGSYSIECRVNDEFNESHIMVKSFNVSDKVDQNLVAYYPFTGNANDESSNTNNGTVYGATLTQDRHGNANSAYYFDGVNDYIDLGNNQSLKPDFPISISMWKRSYKKGAAIFTNDFNNDKYFGITIGERPSISYGNGGSPGFHSRKSWVTNYISELGTWYHIVCIFYSNSYAEIYINGMKHSGFFEGSAAQLVYSSGNANIGRTDASIYAGPTYYQGYVDELRLYSKALSSEEVLKLYKME